MTMSSSNFDKPNTFIIWCTSIESLLPFAHPLAPNYLHRSASPPENTKNENNIHISVYILGWWRFRLVSCLSHGHHRRHQHHQHSHRFVHRSYSNNDSALWAVANFRAFALHQMMYHISQKRNITFGCGSMGQR